MDRLIASPVERTSETVRDELSDTPGSSTNATSTTKSEKSTGFKSFWNRSDKDAQSPEVTFVRQDPSKKRSM